MASRSRSCSSAGSSGLLAHLLVDAPLAHVDVDSEGVLVEDDECADVENDGGNAVVENDEKHVAGNTSGCTKCVLPEMRPPKSSHFAVLAEHTPENMCLFETVCFRAIGSQLIK